MNNNCHFCFKGSGEVEFIINGPFAALCNECIELYTEIIEEEKGKKYIEFLRET